MTDKISETRARKISFSEKTAVPTERPGDFYLSFLGLKPENLEHKTILNIGAGGSDLQADLKQHDVKVLNCDLRYEKTPPETESALIAADMTALPFSDDSTDIAVALYSAGHPPASTHAGILQEMVRVSREKAVIYPCRIHDQLANTIEEHGWKDVLKIEGPKFDPTLLFANMDRSKGFIGNLGRLIKNAYYALDVEAIGKIFYGTKRVTIDSAALKSSPAWKEIIEELVRNGLDIS